MKNWAAFLSCSLFSVIISKHSHISAVKLDEHDMFYFLHPRGKMAQITKAVANLIASAR